jgi:hypothetical protein
VTGLRKEIYTIEKEKDKLKGEKKSDNKLS